MSDINKLNGDYEVNYVLQVHLGDAIWSQTLIKELSNGKPIIWGTESQFVEGLQRAYPDVFWIDVKALNPDYQHFKIDCIIGGVRVIPIGHSNAIMKVPYKEVMKAKYDMYSMDWKTWKDTMYKRDFGRERRLYEELGLEYGEKYNLINNRFRSDESGVVDIKLENNYKNIQMKKIKGYSLFDWSYVVENATEIHTVGSSINYILELLELKTDVIHLYKRLPDENHYHNYDYILKRHKYIFH
jgi:hypothetical protein